ncbi:MAG: glutamate--tRNA ligase [Verrucomicrobiales bacterium]|nr:glutamate--tRNA ligase [Verrucomicrobiales bacterium]
MTVRTRFAPSPTGFLHIGGARTALYNWLYARKHGGKFVIRVEDTDAARSTDASQSIILDGLRWLGLEWDEGPDAGGDNGPYFQSQRHEIYQAYLQKLKDSDLVYDDDGAVRFRVPDKEITVNDAICGTVTVNLKKTGSTRWDPEAKKEVEANPDIVIRRPDGSFIFHFVNVVDDIEMGITHVIRGEDHLSNTPKHIALYEAFGSDLPTFAHIPLNLNKDGSKMSKRDQGALIHEYIENGFLPAAVNNYMALLGWSSGSDRELYFSLDEILEDFDLKGVNSSNSKFDFEKCKWMNAEHIKALPADKFLQRSAPFLESEGIDPKDSRVPACLELARERAETLADITKVILPVFTDNLEYDQPSVEKVVSKDGMAEVLSTLATHLAECGDWTTDGIKASIQAAAESLDLKMGAFMFPCRVATMGSTAGADLVPMLELIGQDRVVSRIRDFKEKYLS